jgi:hypothetical protein
MSCLSKKNQAKAQEIADGILRRAAGDRTKALDESYKHGMWALNNSRSRTVWNIADEAERIVRAANFDSARTV